MGARRVVYRVLVGKPKGQRSLGRWEDNIKMDFQEVEFGMDWIYLAQNRGGGRLL
jgi:hypothetical protein